MLDAGVGGDYCYWLLKCRREKVRCEVVVVFSCPGAYIACFAFGACLRALWEDVSARGLEAFSFSCTYVDGRPRWHVVNNARACSEIER